MQIQTLKREALEERQYLERLLTVYDAFQNYVEALKSSINGEVTGDELLVVSERFRLKFAEYENLFYEWEDGEQHLNAGLSALSLIHILSLQSQSKSLQCSVANRTELGKFDPEIILSQTTCPVLVH